ncbi:2-keto-4-pentenoate hydratase [Streptomyces gobiensis]|uniref:2-keto-4-pentenoate hydratase n=1 Tax=Streptomyces gobiensis TaxID=2875706 RepID=UPI001E343727|nr:fumarylacetoacetate hydrolase family protein [Streptomyces gobiensis]UGY94314.1 fumarylacetoacetate hydrolase family protein [Streptomyces gobiensis]
MNSHVLRDMASALNEAHQTRKPVQTITQGASGVSLSDAYEIQREQLDRWVADGARIRGFKVGLTSVAAQREMNVREPVLGQLTGSMFLPEHQPVDAAGFIQPRIEPALAFVLREPLRGPEVTVADAVRAVEYVLPALEISDSRIRGWAASAVDMAADNACCGGVVLGGTPVALSDVDLRLCGCVLYRNGEVVATGAGGVVLGSPINALVWAANASRSQDVALEAGHVVLASAITKAIPAETGDTVTTTLAGVGSVTTFLSR